MSSYTVYEKDNEAIENILTNIKDLVAKKLNLLINIIFNRDQHSWFSSLKIKEDDSNALKHYTGLITLTNNILALNNVQDIPESLVENFSHSLLQTSELNNQINKLVFKHFG
jgi:hypothetical protein